MDNFTQLWRSIAQTLDLPADDAQRMAKRLNAAGIQTWEDWVAAGEVIA
jgi:hypothetical protein